MKLAKNKKETLKLLLKNSKVKRREKTKKPDIQKAYEYAEDIVETVREPLIVLNTSLKVMSANKSFYDTFKVKEKETKNRLIYRLGNGQWNIPALRKLLKKILPKKNFFDNFEVEHDFPKIGKKTMLLNARQLDHLSLILLAIEDITEQKKAEEELRESEYKFKRLYDANLIGIIFWDIDGNINQANGKFLQMVGYTEDEILSGKVRWKDITPPEYAPLDKKAISEMKETGVCTPFEKEYIRKDGKRISVVLYAAFLKGRKDIGLCYIQDITKQKKAEEDLKKNEEKIKYQMEQLKELDKAKTDFLNIVSHELKTPLTAIYVNMELLEEAKEKLSEKNINNLNALRRNSNQLRFLIDNILEIARIQSNRFELNISEINLGDCISSVENDFKILAEKKNIKLLIELDKPIKISTDKTRLTEILTNLIDNAIKFTEEGYVKVKVRKQDDNLLVKIIDTGIGIPEDKQSKVFEKFYQISTPLKSEFGGTGLGLSITRQLVELLGGKINFKSESGKGSTFYFKLPIKYHEKGAKK